MIEGKAISVLQRIKQEDGSYVIYLPITTTKEVIANEETGESMADILNNVIRVVQSESYTLLEDFATLVGKIAGLVDENITANHIYRDNMKTADGIKINNGIFTPGSITSTSDGVISYSLSSPLVLEDKPLKFQLKDIKNITGDFNISLKVTFNALDSSPTWIDISDYYKNDLFYSVGKLDKDPNRNWAINFVFQASRTSSEGSLEVSDFMILHI